MSDMQLGLFEPVVVEVTRPSLTSLTSPAAPPPSPAPLVDEPASPPPLDATSNGSRPLLSCECGPSSTCPSHAGESAPPDLTVDARSGQYTLFDGGRWWEESWRGMPAFEMEEQRALRILHVHFASEADVLKFAELIGQRITLRTRFIWYPPAEIGSITDRAYVRSSEA